MMPTPIRYGPLPGGQRRALGSIVQRMPLSYAWNGVPDVQFGWWWTPDTDTPWTIPAPPVWNVHLKAVSDTENGDFFAELIDHTVITDGPIVRITKAWYHLDDRDGRHTGLGLTVWTTQRVDGITFLTFRFTNGIPGVSKPIRFQRLEIEFSKTGMNEYVTVRGQRKGETVVPGDGRASLVYQIVPRDEPQFFPIRGVLVREVALCADGEAIDRAQGDWLGQFLSLPVDYRAFGPLKSTIPSRGSQAEGWFLDLGLLHGCEASGNSYNGGASGYVTPTTAFGPWQPIDHNTPYTHGGQGIDMGLGWERNPQAAMLHVQLQRHFMERMPIACVEEHTGAPLREDQRPPFAYDHSRGAGDTSQIPAFRVPLWNPSAPPAPYEYLFDPARDDAWHAVDSSHGIRAMRHAINAWWMAADFSAREDLIQIGEDAAYGDWSPRGVPPFTPTYPGQYIVPSLRTKLLWTTQAPGSGGWLERSFGWTLTARAALYALTPPGEARRANKAWIEDAVSLAVIAQHPMLGWTQNASWSWTSAMPETETGIQSFEWAIVAHGLACCAYSSMKVGSRRFNQIRDLIARGSKSLYVDVHPVPGAGGTVGPPKYVASYRSGQPLMVDQCVGYAVNGEELKADVSHVYHCIALWARIKNDPAILYVMETQWIPGRNLDDVHEWVKSITEPSLRAWTQEAESVLATFSRFSKDGA